MRWLKICGAAAVILPWVMAGVATAGTAASMVAQNQATQHAKGAAEAQQTFANAASAEATKIGPAQTSPAVQDQASTLAVANKKRQAALAAGMVSTFGPNGQPPPPASLVSAPQAFATGMKTTLGS